MSMNNHNTPHNTLIYEVAEKYKRDGYDVILEPMPHDLPFSLGFYNPDLLVKKSEDEGYIIEVKTKSSAVSVDKYQEVSEIVSQHEGWRFLLVTGEDASPRLQAKPLSLEQIKKQITQADKLLAEEELEGAFLLYWVLLEALMRRQAEESLLPIEKFQTSSLIKHLYSHGELTMEQFDMVQEFLKIRNEVVHGFQTSNLAIATKRLSQLVHELLN